MPGSKLDVYKDVTRIETYGEAFLRSANLISQGFFDQPDIITRQLLENLGFTKEMTRAQVLELATQLKQPNVISSTKDIHADLERVLRELRYKKIFGIILGRPEWFTELMEYIWEYCADTSFHDRQ